MTKRPIDIAFDAHMSHERMAGVVIRRRRLVMCTISVAAVLSGFVLSIFASDAGWFARSGAALTALSIALASTALNYERAHNLVRAAGQLVGESGDDQIAGLMASVQRQILKLHLAIGAVGSLIWGFGDLLAGIFLR